MIPRHYRTYLKVSEAAQQSGRSVEFIRRQFDAGILSGVRTSAGYRLIDPASVERMNRHVTVSIAARELSCSPGTIRIWFDAGRLEGHRDYGRRMITVESIAALKDVA